MNSSKELKAHKKKLRLALTSQLIESLNNRPEEWEVLPSRALMHKSLTHSLRVDGIFIWYGPETLVSLKLWRAIRDWRRNNAMRQELESLSQLVDGLKMSKARSAAATEVMEAGGGL